MIGDAVLYAVRRASSGAVDSLTRHAVWYGIAVAFFLAGLFFGFIVVFQVLEAEVGTFEAAGIMGLASVVIGALALSVPGISNWLERRRNAKAMESPITATANAVDQEAREAVDYFGALQVVGTAFVFGLGAARKLRR